MRAVEVYRGGHVTRLAMKLMALTFVRIGELIGARWEEFDLEAERWNIPAERMKMRTPHIVRCPGRPWMCGGACGSLGTGRATSSPVSGESSP